MMLVWSVGRGAVGEREGGIDRVRGQERWLCARNI